MLIQLSYDIVPEILLYFAGFFAVMYALYRSYFLSIVDPLFIFVFTTAFASVLVVEVVPDIASIVNFFICQIFLFAGFATVHGRHLAKCNLPDKELCFDNIATLQMTAYLLLAIYITGNLILYFTKGFALLSDAPTTSKVANFQGGFGIFRKINWAAGGFITVGLAYLYLKLRRRKFLLMLLIVTFFTALEGSKGALLRVILAFMFLIYHPLFRSQLVILNSLKKYLPIGLIAVLSVFFTVLLKENEDSEAALFAFLRRLLYSGDAMLYYNTPINENYFANYSFADYPAYIMNTILGFLRLAPYKDAFGNVMVENVFPEFAQADVIVGPNTPFYIEGKIFFGYYGAFIHSFLIGTIYAFIRRTYFSLRNGSAFKFVFWGCLCQLGGIILTDTSLFVTILFDTCFFVLPTYAIAYFIVNEKVVIKRFNFFVFKQSSKV